MGGKGLTAILMATNKICNVTIMMRLKRYCTCTNLFAVSKRHNLNPKILKKVKHSYTWSKVASKSCYFTIFVLKLVHPTCIWDVQKKKKQHSGKATNYWLHLLLCDYKKQYFYTVTVVFHWAVDTLCKPQVDGAFTYVCSFAVGSRTLPSRSNI